MILLPIHTPALTSDSDLALVLRAHGNIAPGDILVVSSKAIALTEGAGVDLRTITPSSQAQEWSEKTNRSAAFCEAVLGECVRLNGHILGAAPGAMLTEVRPAGLTRGVILVANAGLDESNVERGFALGWPHDPVRSAQTLRHAFGNSIAVIVSDSVCHPRRWGVTAIALTASGIEPLTSMIGAQDLFGRPLSVTVEATGDQLATAANMLMGNAAQSQPAAVIRDHGLSLSDFSGWVDGIDPEEDMFNEWLVHD